MPACAAFVDDLRAEFGAAEINNEIKRGLRPEAKPEHRVYFAEAGHVLGQPAGTLGVEVSPVVAAVMAESMPKRDRG